MDTLSASENTIASNDQDFNLEAEKLFERLNKVIDGKKRSAFRGIDPLYEDEETGARVYVGNKVSAEDRQLLKKLDIHCIVNCTTDLPLKFKDEGIDYFRYCIGMWEITKGYDYKEDMEVLRYADTVLDYIDDRIKQKKNVLIHCLAGAHRAGSTAILFLMGRYKTDFNSAFILSKKQRPLIQPIGVLKEFLFRVDEAIVKLNQKDALKTDSRWYRENISRKKVEVGVEEKI